VTEADKALVQILSDEFRLYHWVAERVVERVREFDRLNQKGNDDARNTSEGAASAGEGVRPG
jgi:hypothetical protein